MRDFCGFDAVNGADSGRKPLCEYKADKEKISRWRVSWTFVVAVETKSHLLSATMPFLGDNSQLLPRMGVGSSSDTIS